MVDSRMRMKASIIILSIFLVINQLVFSQSVWARGFGGGGGHIDGFDREFDSDFTRGSLANADSIGRVFSSPTQHTNLLFNGNAIRDAYRNHDIFNATWWESHHGGWYFPWMNRYSWGWVAWPMLSIFLGVNLYDCPIYYDFGNNITYQNGTVYYGAEPAATDDEYYKQALKLAKSAPPIYTPGTDAMQIPANSGQERHWLPFGIYSLIQDGQIDSSKFFQLFVNGKGLIYGNYYDTMTDEVKPVSGAIEEKSMRAAWQINGVNDVVYDTGVANLLKPDGSILVHFSPDKTQQWNLVHLE